MVRGQRRNRDLQAYKTLSLKCLYKAHLHLQYTSLIGVEFINPLIKKTLAWYPSMSQIPIYECLNSSVWFSSSFMTLDCTYPAWFLIPFHCSPSYVFYFIHWYGRLIFSKNICDSRILVLSPQKAVYFPSPWAWTVHCDILMKRMKQKCQLPVENNRFPAFSF